MQSLQQVVNTLNTLVFIKDLSHRYIYCNERFAQACGEDSPEGCYGKTDENLIWREHKDLYRQGDIQVFQGHMLCNMLEPVVEGHMLVNKQPLLDQYGNITGVVCSSIDISNLAAFKNQTLTYPIEKGFNLGEHFDNAVLSLREFQVLKMTLMGHTAKKIAELLHLSPKSVESYISRIKIKMQCESRGDIIYHAVCSGLYQRLLPSMSAS